MLKAVHRERMTAMGTRFCLIFASLTLLSGCIAVPRFEMTQRIEFNYAPPNMPVPMSSEDLLCCADCQA